MIEVQHISKSFKDVKVLDDICAIFQEGKVNFTIGKSGSRKQFS